MNKKIFCIAFLILCIASLIEFSHQHGFPAFSMQKEKRVIVIDVGHGGNDPGKVGASGIKEKDVNLEIAGYLQDYLIAQDYIVYLTRDSDYGLYEENDSNKKSTDMRNRIQFFSDKNANYVISIHQNSFPDATQHGAQTFYHSTSEASQKLAESIQDSLLTIDNTNNRVSKSSDNYYILKKSTMPAVIVECGFLSNPEETARLTDSNYQKKLAYAISIGVCQYDNGTHKNTIQKHIQE